MKHILNEQQRLQLDQRIVEVEKKTGVQIVLAVIERSDAYAELPWKAFALGSSVAGLGAVLLNLLRPGWHSNLTVLFAVVATLATGAACALLSIVLPAFARLFLAAHRAEVEAKQYAESLFLSRQVFATRGRTGLLLLLSMFEQRVVLLPDSGLRKRLSREAEQAVVDSITTSLVTGSVSAALANGLAGLEQILAATATGAARENELPNAIIEKEGV